MTFEEFMNKFKEAGKDDWFSYKGFELLYDYIEDFDNFDVNEIIENFEEHECNFCEEISITRSGFPFECLYCIN